MLRAFLPDGDAAAAARRDPFPEPPPAPPGAHRSRRRVQFDDLDEMRHVNNAVYLDCVGQAAVDAAEACGWPMDRAIGLDIAIVARQHRIEYLRPAVYGDELVVVTWLSDWRPASVVRHVAIQRASGALRVGAPQHRPADAHPGGGGEGLRSTDGDVRTML